MFRVSFVGVLSLCIIAAYSASARPRHHNPKLAGKFNKVLLVVFENAGFEEVITLPTFSTLIQQGAFLRNMHGVSHPSQPNYIAMIAGDTFGVPDDLPINLNRPHLGNLIEDQKKSWKVYAEQYPGNCYLGESAGGYVRKHVPFISFKNVQNDPTRCANIVDANNFYADVAKNQLPEFSLYVPDLIHDGHDSSPQEADDWLSEKMLPIFNNPDQMKDLLVIVTFDESDFTDPDNHIFAVLLGGAVTPGSISDAYYDHYSILRTIEDGLALNSLNRADAQAVAFDGIWK